MFSSEFCEIFKNNFFYRTSLVAASAIQAKTEKDKDMQESLTLYLLEVFPGCFTIKIFSNILWPTAVLFEMYTSATNAFRFILLDSL